MTKSPTRPRRTECVENWRPSAKAEIKNIRLECRNERQTKGKYRKCGLKTKPKITSRKRRTPTGYCWLKWSDIYQGQFPKPISHFLLTNILQLTSVNFLLFSYLDNDLNNHIEHLIWNMLMQFFSHAITANNVFPGIFKQNLLLITITSCSLSAKKNRAKGDLSSARPKQLVDSFTMTRLYVLLACEASFISSLYKIVFYPVRWYHLFLPMTQIHPFYSSRVSLCTSYYCGSTGIAGKLKANI